MPVELGDRENGGCCAHRGRSGPSDDRSTSYRQLVSYSPLSSFLSFSLSFHHLRIPFFTFQQKANQRQSLIHSIVGRWLVGSGLVERKRKSRQQCSFENRVHISPSPQSQPQIVYSINFIQLCPISTKKRRSTGRGALEQVIILQWNSFYFKNQLKLPVAASHGSIA